MDTNVKFSSTRFLPALPEHVQLSPRHYGFELAHFLATALANRGVVTSYPLQSEWSWYVEYKDENGNVLQLCCANLKDSATEWLCFLDSSPERPLELTGPMLLHAARLMATLQQVLESEPTVRNIQWFNE